MEMMSLIKYLVFLPFFVVFMITLMGYLIAGYRKGLGRSLLSLVATIIATVLSFLCAKGVSRVATEPVVAILPPELLSGLSELGTLGNTLIESALQVVFSFLFFGGFFVIILTILKSISKRMPMGKLEALNKESAGSKIAGMGIRTIDAALVTMMLLLPLYGTVAMAAPSAASLMRMTESFSTMSQQQSEYYPEQDINDFESESEYNSEYDSEYETDADSEALPQEESIPAADDVEIIDLLETLENHPILLPYKYGPAAWVYSGLSSFSMNGQTVKIASAVNSLEGMLTHINVCVEAFQAEDTERAVGAIGKLIDYTRENVIHQKWSYSMVMAMVGEMDTMISEYSGESADEEELTQMYNQLRPLLDMSYEDYTKNAEAALDFAAWLVEMFSQYGESIFTTEGEAILGNELYVRFGNLLNTSEQTIGFKRVILQSYADIMFNTLPDPADTNNTEYYQAREGIPNSGAEFINKYFGDGFVPEEDRAAEAAVFIALFGGADSLDAAEAFVRHPSFGADAVLECMDENLYINMEDQYMGQQLAESYRAQEAYNYFDNELKGYDDTPLEYGFTFSDVVRNYLIFELGFEEGYGYYPDDPYANNSNGLSSFNPNDNSIVTLKPGAYEEIPVVQENY